MKRSILQSMKRTSYIKIYARSLIRSYVFMLILFFITALIITYTSISDSIIPAATSIIIILCISYAAIYSSIHIKMRGWLHGGLMGIIFMLILITLGGLFVSGYDIVDKLAFYQMLIGILAGSIGGMIGVNMK